MVWILLIGLEKNRGRTCNCMGRETILADPSTAVPSRGVRASRVGVGVDSCDVFQANGTNANSLSVGDIKLDVSAEIVGQRDRLA